MPAVGGIAGASLAAAIKSGVTKGMLSNEAGLGTAPMAHAMADTEHPFQQGLWGAFEVFIDTIVICTISAFTILSSGALSSGTSGVELVIHSFSTVFSPQVSGTLVSFCILTFCLTTQIGYFVYYETAVVNIFGQRSITVFKWLYLVPGILFAGFADVDKIWVFVNICVGGCAIPNLIAVLALSGVVFKLMKDYLHGKNEYATSIVDGTGNYIKKYGEEK
jgi:AGCS family alanine or glycine:cation symporter